MIKKQTKYIVVSLMLVSMVSFSLTHQAFARGNDDDGSFSRVETNEDDNENENEQESTTHRETREQQETNHEKEMRSAEHEKRTSARQAELKERTENRKQELTDRFESMKENRKTKLAGKRLELCEKRQETINKHITDSVGHGQKKIETFSQIEQRVKDFYVSKELSSTDYEGAVAVAANKKANAIAAIESVEAFDFKCDEADGDKPSTVVRAAFTARRTALKEYQSAVKELIQVVRKALNTTLETTSEKPSERSEQ